eukprot:g17033.t1
MVGLAVFSYVLEAGQFAHYLMQGTAKPQTAGLAVCEFLRLRRADRQSSQPRKSSSSLGSSLYRTLVASKPPLEHPDPEEAGVVIIAPGISD